MKRGGAGLSPRCTSRASRGSAQRNVAWIIKVAVLCNQQGFGPLHHMTCQRLSPRARCHWQPLTMKQSKGLPERHSCLQPMRLSDAHAAASLLDPPRLFLFSGLFLLAAHCGARRFKTHVHISTTCCNPLQQVHHQRGGLLRGKAVRPGTIKKYLHV